MKRQVSHIYVNISDVTIQKNKYNEYITLKIIFKKKMKEPL